MRGFYAFTRRARVRPKPRLYWLFLKSGAGVEILRFFEKEDPFSSGRARDARSLRLGQHFVKALDFDAVEALVANLQPRAEGFRRS